MHNHDFNRVLFYSNKNAAGGCLLSRGDNILRGNTKLVYDDINDVLELYNIKKCIDNEVYFKGWSQDDIDRFKKTIIVYGQIVGQFISNINDSNVVSYYEQLIHGYVNSFWNLINNQKAYKRISVDSFESILRADPHEIMQILSYKSLVDHYNMVLRDFLINYDNSAEILLSIYEVKDVFCRKNEIYLPRSLTIKDKENIISVYIDRENCNLNYLRLIQHAKNREDFKLSDKVRLKAKRKAKLKTDIVFKEESNNAFRKYGISVSFSKNQERIKNVYLDGSAVNYSYSLNHLVENNDSSSLFLNFIFLFEFLDDQFRIDLVHKERLMGVMERVMGIRSESEYKRSIRFNLNEITSNVQIFAYCSILSRLGLSLECILQDIYTQVFHEEFGFAKNARLLMPSSNVSTFEKIRILAPEFESVLKQYKLFVEEGEIDFDLFQIASNPPSIKDIPSLNYGKYIYLKESNEELISCLCLFFSDQTMLTYVDPFKEKSYLNLYQLITLEDVRYNEYEVYQKIDLDYLVDKGFLWVDESGFIRITNVLRVMILKDLYENEVASFYHYKCDFQREAIEMERLGMIFFENALLSRPEQDYLNFYLNKSEFTNGLDLRNRYLHGTQANPDEQRKHEFAYYTYMKLFVLVLLKIGDDLFISKQRITNESRS